MIWFGKIHLIRNDSTGKNTRYKIASEAIKRGVVADTKQNIEGGRRREKIEPRSHRRKRILVSKDISLTRSRTASKVTVRKTPKSRLASDAAHEGPYCNVASSTTSGGKDNLRH